MCSIKLGKKNFGDCAYLKLDKVRLCVRLTYSKPTSRQAMRNPQRQIVWASHVVSLIDLVAPCAGGKLLLIHLPYSKDPLWDQSSHIQMPKYIRHKRRVTKKTIFIRQWFFAFGIWHCVTGFLVPDISRPRNSLSSDLATLEETTTYLLTYLLSHRPFVPLTALTPLITDAHSSLSTAFRRLLLNSISSRTFSTSSSHLTSTSFQFTLKYFLNCPSLICSYYVSSPFQSVLSNICYYV